MHTEQEKLDAAIKAMAKAGWPVDYHNGEPLLLSEGNLAVSCFNAGYDFAAPCSVYQDSPSDAPYCITCLKAVPAASSPIVVESGPGGGWNKSDVKGLNLILDELAEATEWGAGQLDSNVRQLRDFINGAAAASIEGGGLGAQWISVDERLPEEWGSYLCHRDFIGEGGQRTKYTSMSVYNPNDGGFSHNSEVTHWQPLPSAPATV